MRLRSLAAAAAALASCSLTSADADWHPTVKLETGGYADSDNVNVLTPSVAGNVEDPTRGARVGGSYLVDVVSAASVDIVSTASKRWTEVRHAGTLDLKYKPRDLGVSANAYASFEPDYRSLGAGGAFLYDFGGRSHTLSLGYTFAQDTAGRAGTPFAIFSRVIDKHAFAPGLTVTIDDSTLVSVFADIMLERGDSSKPYRYVPFFASASGIPAGASISSVNLIRLPERALEHLPSSRNRLALTGRLLHRWSRATLRLVERVYGDDWGLVATTTDVRVPVDLGSRWRAYPHLRVHLQTGASFWQRAYTLGADGSYPTYFAGDRELGPLRTLTLGGGAQVELGGFILSAQLDGIYTRFLDAIFIKDRFGALANLGVEAHF